MDTIKKEDHYLYDVHIGLSLPPYSKDTSQTGLVRGSYIYYHYLCDGVDDRGWGCGYRTLQTICSWLNINTISIRPDVPSIAEIQNVLVQLEDKPPPFAESREWIGSFEVCLVIDQLYNIPSKIIHAEKGSKLRNISKTLKEHFNEFGSPIMMGGDKDCSSKGILGVHIGSEDDIYYLVLDPHYVGRSPTGKLLQNKMWVKWQHLNDFNESSFYNLCLPQIAPKT